MPSYFPLQTLQ